MQSMEAHYLYRFQAPQTNIAGKSIKIHTFLTGNCGGIILMALVLILSHCCVKAAHLLNLSMFNIQAAVMCIVSMKTEH
jgi:hypothetical protein